MASLSNEHHTSLYRKYRPISFDQVVGQEGIVNSLKNSLNSGSIPHALLFSGSRGLGKTSIARIFAKDLRVSEVDTHEIDAASTRGIDDIRALKEEVNVLPRESKKKVYIIDEVHMLTKEAFNALLKTLEEPPAHIVFILATTELNKVPDTIVSRCQVHIFLQPDLKTLSKHLAYIAEQEGKSLSEEASLLLAEAGNGSYRDALGYLQKALSSSSKDKLEREDVESILRILPRSRIFELLQNIQDADGSKMVSTLLSLQKESTAAQILSDLVSIVRLIILYRISPAETESLFASYSVQDQEKLKTLSKEGSSINSHLLLKLLEGSALVRTSHQSDLALEALLLDYFSGVVKK